MTITFQGPAQAQHWIPGRMVSFTLYTLPEPSSAAAAGVLATREGLAE